MKIALDYDNCYTLDPRMWNEFIVGALARGHEVKCVTMRNKTEGIHPMLVEVIYTNRRAKRDFALLTGWVPDVWIDDTPEAILMDFT